nr:uncharacterized protein LOC109178709 [Ipomoea trifida]GMD48745.1 uncharacterized protein LOC109178709 [Ipomoea batatas]
MSRDFSVTLSDFQKRFARLLDKSFCSMDYKLAMSGYVAGMREKDKKSCSPFTKSSEMREKDKKS